MKSRCSCKQIDSQSNSESQNQQLPFWSAKYLISAGCDKIFVDNATLTGSIGVFGMIPSFGKAIKKNLKVNPVSLGTGRHSTMGSGIVPLTPEEEAWYQQEIEGIYDDFVGVVATMSSTPDEFTRKKERVTITKVHKLVKKL